VSNSNVASAHPSQPILLKKPIREKLGVENERIIQELLLGIEKKTAEVQY
jgi:hypothetical protein